MRKTEDHTAGQRPDIIRAAYEGAHQTVATLLNEGVDVNTVDPDDNLTVLHIACLQGDLALAQIVLEHDKRHGDVDFSIRSKHRPRLAWQFAMNGNFIALAELVDDAGLAKRTSTAPRPQP